MEIQGKTVLITGATGFIGGRLVERLVLSGKRMKVRCLVHNPFRTARFAGLPLEIVFGDVTSIKAMREATLGCDVVVHCAAGTPYETVNGTQNVIRAALERHVKKFIHLSSVAVFGYSPSAERVGDERIDYHQTNNAYCDSKIDSEKIAFSYHDSKKLPLVVLRPVHVFGPYSKPWTIEPINMLNQRRYVLINGGLTPSNVVYVDNVVDAIELAIEEDSAVGHAFTISSDRITRWREVFSGYAKMFSDPPPLLNIRSEDLKIERTKQNRELLEKTFFNPRQLPSVFSLLSSRCKVVHSFISQLIRLQARNKIIDTLFSRYANSYSIDTLSRKGANGSCVSTLGKIPESWLVKVFTLPFKFPMKRAESVLGYKPRVSFEDGMKTTEEWVRTQRLI